MGINPTAGPPKAGDEEDLNIPEPSMNLETLRKETPFTYSHPLPNAVLVSPYTTVAFRTKEKVDKDSIKDKIAVQGDVSGDHDGGTRLLRDNRTVYFTPKVAFMPGERVFVKVEAGIKTTDGNSLPAADWSFTMSWNKMDTYSVGKARRPANATDDASSDETLDIFRKVQDINWLLGIPDLTPDERSGTEVDGSACDESKERELGAPYYIPSCSYRTLPKRYPRSKVTPEGDLGRLSPGYIFTSVPAQVIMTSLGDPVFFDRTSGLFRVEVTPDGQLMSSYTCTSFGEDYKQRRVFHVQHGGKKDPHDCRLTRNGNALLIIYDVQLLDVEKFNPEATLPKAAVGAVVQEVGSTGEVILEWRSWDHLPRSLWESWFLPKEKVFDMFHLNALEEARDGNILLSMRRTSQIVKVDRDTGEVMWRLGGKAGNFRIVNDPKGQFLGQHDVRDLGENRISVFDNQHIYIKSNDYTSHDEMDRSRGAEYDLLFNRHGRPKEARLVNEYHIGITAGALGSYRRMHNGNGVYCLGVSLEKGKLVNNPFYIETDPDGNLLTKMEWTRFHFTGRSVKSQWIGEPDWDPSILLDSNNLTKTLRLHFSWNGATEVKKWRILMGENENKTHLTDVLVEIEKTQFEHWVDVIEGAKKCQYFQAVAIDKKGEEMRRSPIVQTKPCS
ncbi:unnamed protein product [Vitrella brassicaformis CCMP3155]|uniref:SbsA Ig-like domain-containing protein n=1 Tax=Vitrella brassicaformis (strain CCMP3155) TaxID=1169540 RepID=A0A0G4FQS9_VITBC|nr:unnamed protein product [Vitrella brassicaformis CCMP3155]|eukprot:CEM16813.1 unnamed protein product [Vitrella brassicaformis CCMP3155]